MKIGIDIDGIIADFVSSFLPYLNKYCKCKVEDIVSYDFEKNIDISHENIEKLWKEVESNKIYSDLSLVKNSKMALEILARENRIYLISSRKKESHKDTLTWLRRNKIPFDRLILTNGLKDKISSMKKCDIVIEDSLEVARILEAQGIPVLLFEYPWSRIGKKIKFVKNWKQAIKQIKALSR